MNPTHHKVAQCIVTPMQSEAPLYSLSLKYRPTGPCFIFDNVFVPETLVSKIQEGSIAGVFRETLDFKSRACAVLAGEPSSVVLGVETLSGERLAAYPRELKSLRRKLFAGSLLTGLAAFGLFTHGGCLAGAVSLVACTHLFRSALAVPAPLDW